MPNKAIHIWMRVSFGNKVTLERLAITDIVNNSVTNIHNVSAVILSVHRWKIVKTARFVKSIAALFCNGQVVIFVFHSSRLLVSHLEMAKRGQLMGPKPFKETAVTVTVNQPRQTEETHTNIGTFIIKVTYVQFYFILSGCVRRVRHYFENTWPNDKCHTLFLSVCEWVQ